MFSFSSSRLVGMGNRAHSSESRTAGPIAWRRHSSQPQPRCSPNLMMETAEWLRLRTVPRNGRDHSSALKACVLPSLSCSHLKKNRKNNSFSPSLSLSVSICKQRCDVPLHAASLHHCASMQVDFSYVWGNAAITTSPQATRVIRKVSCGANHTCVIDAQGMFSTQRIGWLDRRPWRTRHPSISSSSTMLFLLLFDCSARWMCQASFSVGDVATAGGSAALRTKVAPPPPASPPPLGTRKRRMGQ